MESIINLHEAKNEYKEMCYNAENLFNNFYETNIATEKYIKLIKNLEEKNNYEE